MSSWPKISHPQLKTLARFINTLRPDWDVAGIEAQLGFARDKAPGPDLAVAAVRAAMSAKNRTPAVIGLDGEHWRTTGVTVLATPRATPANDLCRVCGQQRHRCELVAASHPLDGHKFEPAGGELFDTKTGEAMPSTDHTAKREEVRQAVREFSQQNKEIDHAEHAS